MLDMESVMIEKLIYWLKYNKSFRIFAVLLSLLTILSLCTGCGQQTERDEKSQAPSRSAVKGFISSHCHEQRMRKHGAALYSQIYIMAEGMRHRGVSPHQAFDRASEEYLASMALSERARKKGIRVSGSEVNHFISDTLDDMKDTGTYKEMQAEAARHGTTIEKILRSNRESYKKQIAVVKLYQQERSDYLQSSVQTTAEEQQAWEKKWTNIQDRAIAAYKKTPQGRKIQERLPKMRRVYCSRHRSNAQEARKSAA